jgi:endonuclease I
MFATSTRAMASVRRSLPVLLLCSWSAAVVAQPPPGYYNSVDASNPTVLRSTLHAVIRDHIRFPYSSSGTDTWSILEAADEAPTQPGFILDLYHNASFPKAGGGNANYNREHAWPNSYGFPDDTSTNYPYTDCHALFLADDGYNSSRGNNLYRTCNATCTEKTTVANHGRGGGSGVYPGNSNWRSGSGPEGIWETWIGRRGDVARALFYMDVRYEGGNHGVTGAAEPDLILTDDLSRIATSGGENAPVAYMGELGTLLAWNAQDPVDDLERQRNDVVESFQENRNPFIDHPEWATCLFQGICAASSTCTPGPTSLCLSNGRFEVTAQWQTKDGAGAGQAVPLTADTGYFWFFASTNVEVVIKVLDACSFNQRFWVYAGGLTDVLTVLTVRDTQTGQVKTYTNPQGTPFRPIQDTDAFATCTSEPPPSTCIPAAQCCKICTSSKACGDTCIRLDFTCQQPRGCACNSWEVCR